MCVFCDELRYRVQTYKMLVNKQQRAGSMAATIKEKLQRTQAPTCVGYLPFWW